MIVYSGNCALAIVDANKQKTPIKVNVSGFHYIPLYAKFSLKSWENDIQIEGKYQVLKYFNK